MPNPTDSPPTQAPSRVVELAANLDDATGELAGHAIDQLIQRGALDAWATPITMKKGRPGVTLSVLAHEQDREALCEALLRLTGSFGVRHRPWDRVVLDRQWHERPTRLGPIQLKAGSLNGEAITVKPEFDDVQRLAESAGVSAAEVHRAAAAAADALLAELRSGAGQQAGGGA